MKITDFVEDLGVSEGERKVEFVAAPTKLIPRATWDSLPVDRRLAKNLTKRGYRGLLDHQLQALGFFRQIPIPRDLSTREFVETDDEKGCIHRQFDRILLSFETSAGKTLVAKLFVDAHLRDSVGKKAIYCVPYKALADELYEKFKTTFKNIWSIGISTGDYASASIKGLEKYRAIIVTYDKLNSILRKDKDHVFRNSIACVVLDEFHLINENRGGVIEDVVIKLKGLEVPIIALSATVGNRNELGRWIASADQDSVVVHSDFRPIELKRGILVHCEEPYIEYEDGSKCILSRLTDNSFTNAAANFLTREFPTIIFRQSRGNAESTADRVSKWIKKERREWVKGSVKMSNTTHGEKLSKMIPQGCAYHHAGLTRPDKNAVENLYRERRIRFLAATSTLSTGINLPATVGIVEFKRFDGKRQAPIPKNECLQCMGRIGRPQYDSQGIALIMLNADKKSLGWIEMAKEGIKEEYLTGPPDPVVSAYHKKRNLYSAILGAVAGGYTGNTVELRDYLKRSLCYVQRPDKLKKNAEKVFRDISRGAFPLVRTRGKEIEATRLGKIVNSLYIHPKTAFTLLRACRTLPEDATDLAIVYWACTTSDFKTFRPPFSLKKQWGEVLGLRAAELHLDDYYWGDAEIEAIMTATVLVGSDGNADISAIDTAWIREADLKDLERQWLIQGGDLHAIVGGSGAADWVMHAFSILSRVSGQKALADRCATLALRLKHGIREELIPLAKIRGVGRKRARALYGAGYKRPERLAEADVADVSRIIVGGKQLGNKIATGIIRAAGKGK